MSEHFAGWDERTLDLAILEVTVGLDVTVGIDVAARLDIAGGLDVTGGHARTERPEHDELFDRVDVRDLARFEHAVAELNLAGLGALEPLPAALRERIEADARRHLRIGRGPTSSG